MMCQLSILYAILLSSAHIVCHATSHHFENKAARPHGPSAPLVPSCTPTIPTTTLVSARFRHRLHSSNDIAVYIYMTYTDTVYPAMDKRKVHGEQDWYLFPQQPTAGGCQ